jgi:penicillin G amidase
VSATPAWRRRLDGWLARVVRAGLLVGARRRAPRHAGTIRVRGMLGGARVLFDAHGVPHVRAASDQDALAALGTCHALDRFFQMDMLRRALAGRLTETVGERVLGDLGFPPFGSKRTTLDADRLVRALDVVPSAQRTLDAADEEGRALLDAYVAGVNAGIEALRRARPLEHRLLSLDLEPWTPLDSLVAAKGMALGLSFKWRSVPVVAALAERLADRPAHLAAVLPRAPGADALAHLTWFAEGVGEALGFLPAAPGGVGSNAFLVGGGRTRSGSPILANDPHLQLSLPSVWYLASVKGARYQAVGATLPGAPGVVLGRTPSLAWGSTNAMLDDADVWVEELDGTGLRHRVDGAWRALEVGTQEIRRRGAAPVVFRLRRTHRGPLVSDAFSGYTGPPLSLRATWMAPGRDLEAFLGLGRARSAAEVPAAVQGYGSPAQNLVYADAREGGWRLMGRVPVRGGATDPSLPRDGRTSAEDWTGEVPAASLPRARVGPEDQIVSANHPQVPGDYPWYLSHLYEPAWRAQRIRELLGRRGDLTADDLAAVQRDAHGAWVRRLREAVLLPHGDAARRQRPVVGRALDRLLAWDGDESAASRGALLAHLAYQHLARRTFGALLGEPLLSRFLGNMNLVDEPLWRAWTDPESPWAPPAVRPTLLAEALADALQALESKGRALDTPWGEAHTLTLHHPAGLAPMLAPTFSRGPFAMPGSPYAICSGQYAHDKPFAMTVGPSFRQVVDLADPEGTARMMTFGGQSGSVGSPHYDDLTPLWRAGAWLPMRLETDPDPVASTLLLEPA